MKKRLHLTVAALFLAFAAQAANITGVSYLNHSEPNIYTGGQPESFSEVAAAGVQHVINLRPAAETPDIDEESLVTENGMTYHNLPISGPGDLTRENVEKLDKLLVTAGDDTILVHCASSNRVGALAALRASWLQGKSDEEALAVGNAWGLTKMQPIVEQLLAQ